MTCGRADTNPPGLATAPGATWYCQARTNDPVVAGSVSWKLAGSGTLVDNATADKTVGTSPTGNVSITGSVTEPDLSVTFTSADPKDKTKTAQFTAQRRVRTAQELASRLSAIPGSSAVAAYDSSTRALSYRFSTADDPATKELPITIGDDLRQGSRLRGVATKDTLGLDVGATRIAGTFGLLLGPADAGVDQTPVDRGFLETDDAQPELTIAGIKTVDGGSFTGTGSVGYLDVGVRGSGLSITSTGLSADIDLAGRSLPTAAAGSPLASAALLSTVVGGSPSQPAAAMTGKVRLDASADVAVTSPLLPAGTYTTALRHRLDLTTPTTDLPPLPTVTPDASWAKWVSPLDVQPQVTGRISTPDRDGIKIVNTDASFLSGDFGRTVTAGSVIAASVLNPRTGGTCSKVRVISETELDCVEQAGAPQGDTAPTYRDARLVGGKVATTPAAGSTGADFTPDNTWAAYDTYVIDGDTTALKTTLLSGLYDVANSIKNSDDASWRSALPLVGLVPKDLVPQTTGLRDLAASVRNLTDEAMPADCGDVLPRPLDPDQGAGQPDRARGGAGEAGRRLALKLDPTAPAADRVTLSVVEADGTPQVRAEVQLPARDDTELPLAADCGTPACATGCAARTRTPARPAGSRAAGTPRSPSRSVWPISPTQSYKLVQVLPGTGVTSLHVKADAKADQVALTSALGPLEVRLGAGPAGDYTEPHHPGSHPSYGGHGHRQRHQRDHRYDAARRRRRPRPPRRGHHRGHPWLGQPHLRGHESRRDRRDRVEL